MKTKTTIVITALAIALAVAFAAWSETATIQVSASTGYIDLDFLNEAVSSASNYVNVQLSKTNSQAGGTNDGAPTLTVTISNAYPGAKVEVTFDMYNDGTIPVNIQCTVDAPSVLTVQISPSTVSNLEPGRSQSATLTVTAGDVSESESYSATVSCTYTQAVP